MSETEGQKKYHTVNRQWPEGSRDGRDLKPTPQEAMSAAKRLYRIAMGKPFRGKVKPTNGNRHTWVRGGVLYVNPDRRKGGWHELVHAISHLAARRLYGEAHGPRHAWIERQLIDHVVTNGWLDGKLRRPGKIVVKDSAAAIRSKLTTITSKTKRWQTKAKRAKTALAKLERQRKYYERQIAATVNQ